MNYQYMSSIDRCCRLQLARTSLLFLAWASFDLTLCLIIGFCRLFGRHGKVPKNHLENRTPPSGRLGALSYFGHQCQNTSTVVCLKYFSRQKYLPESQPYRAQFFASSSFCSGSRSSIYYAHSSLPQRYRNTSRLPNSRPLSTMFAV